MTFLSLPPGTVVIQQVLPGSWAEARKLQVEDELICMNGSRVAEMTRHDFCKSIRERPLRLDVSRPVTEKSDTDLARQADTLPVESSVTEATTRGTMCAAQQNFDEPSDELANNDDEGLEWQADTLPAAVMEATTSVCAAQQNFDDSSDELAN